VTRFYSVVALTNGAARPYLRDIDATPGRVYDRLVDEFLLSDEFLQAGKRKYLVASPYGLRDKKYARPLKGGKGNIVMSWNHRINFVGLCLEERVE